jgi:hypothetical protein
MQVKFSEPCSEFFLDFCSGNLESKDSPDPCLVVHQNSLMIIVNMVSTQADLLPVHEAVRCQVAVGRPLVLWRH